MVCQNICFIKRERFQDIDIDEYPIEWALFKPTNHTTISEFARKFVNTFYRHKSNIKGMN